MDEFQEQMLIGTPEDTGPVDHDRVISLISSGSWEEVLVLLTKDMDAWNIDILKLSERFTQHIEQMRGIDLKVPARVLLAAAIIYRLKSETLYSQEDDEVSSETEGALDDLNLDWQMEGGNIVLPPIQLPLRRTPKRNVTLDELVGALEKAMVIKTRRESREFFAIELAGEDITVRIEDLYARINKILEGQESIVFSTLLPTEKITKDDIIKTFASLLHLSNQERVNLEQPELFGEIKIVLHPNVLHGVDEGPKAEDGEF